MSQENVRVTTAVLAAVTALVLAGCGDDEDSTTEATLSPEQKIEQTVDKWAPLFAAAADRAACRYQTQPLCERVDCERVATGPIKNCTPPSSEFRKSFEDATVQDVAIKGDQAGAKLSNGETVELFHRSGNLQAGVEEAGGWLIHKLGGNAGREFIEAAGLQE
jgi:hypothetical protein